MFCMNCGAQLSDAAKFCGSCGAKVELPDLGSSVSPAQTSQMLRSSQPEARHIQQVNDFPENGIQPVRYSTEIPSVKPVRKKSRLVPGLCIAAGAVVVLGGAGAAFYHFNKPLVSKLIMGDAGYAHSVTMNALSGISENGGAVSSAVQQAMSAGIAAAQSGAELSGSSGSGGAVDGGFGVSNEDAVGKALELAAWQINHAAGTRGVTSEFGIKAELEQSVIDALAAQLGASPEQYAELEAILNNLDITLTLSEKDSGDALEYSAGLSTPSGSLGTAQLRYEEDGTASLIFPGMSTTGFSAKLSPHQMEENAAAASFDLERFYGNVSSGLKEAFKDFEIKCENGTTELGTLKFSGMTVQIDLDKTDLCSIAMVVIDAARGDDGLIAYMKSLDDSLTEQSVMDAFEELAKQVGEFRTGSDEAAAKIVYYINGDNSLAGADFTVYGSGENTAQLRFLSEGRDCEISASENGDTLLQAHVKGESDTSGSMTATIANFTYGGNKEDISFTVNYRDVGTANVFGLPMTTGTFTMNISAEDTQRFLEDEMDLPEEIAAAAGSSEISLTLAPKGRGAECSFVMSAQNIGSLTYSCSVDEVSGEVAPKPGSECRLVEFDSASEDDMTALGEDIMKYYQSLADSDPLVGAVYSLQEKLASVPDPGDDYFDFDTDNDHYYDYDWDDDDDPDWNSDTDWEDRWGFHSSDSTEVTDADIASANTAAQRMKLGCDVFFKKMSAQGIVPESGSAMVLIYVEDGKWNTYALTCIDSDFTDFLDIPKWSDGVDHWGAEWAEESEAVPLSEDSLTNSVSSLMPDIENAAFIVYVQGSDVLGAVFANNVSDLVFFPEPEDFRKGSWDFGGSGRAGASGGCAVGTAPTLALDTSAE